MTRWFVPGRIEVLGKHTDYAGGSTLVAAVDRGVTISIEPGDSEITVSTDAAPGELSLAAGHDQNCRLVTGVGTHKPLLTVWRQILVIWSPPGFGSLPTCR